MKKQLITSAIIMAVCAGLVGCATRSTPADVTDANGLNAGDAQGSGVQNFSVSGQDNSFNSELTAGPHNGQLAKRRFYFAFNSDQLEPSALPALQAHADYLKAHPSAKILLEGNTDSRGSREYNIALGQHRADAVEKQLEIDGAPHSQIRTISYGAERPIALGQTQQDYAQNRRTDLVYEAE